MEKKHVALIFIAALFFCFGGVMADDNGGSGASSSVGAAYSSNDSSGNRTEIQTDADDIINTSVRPDNRGDTSPGVSTGTGSTGSMDCGMKNPDGSSPGAGDSTNATTRETETEIEHGIATITADEEEKLAAADALPGDGVASAGSKAQSAIMARSLVSLSSLPGAGPARMADQAKTVDASFRYLSAAERLIQERNGMVTFFFGGDDEAADTIRSHVSKGRIALDEIERMAEDPTESPAVKTFTQARLRIIRAEMARVQALADAEKLKTGLFG